MVVIAPAASQAAGLGRLTVLSALGQPLLAEVELVSVQREELSTLAARIAPPEAFSLANMQFNPALASVRVSVERRAGGQHFLRLTTARPMNEPFVELLLELTWNSGRLVREYTALLDPPGYAPQQPVAPAVVPAAPAVQAVPIPAPKAAAPKAPAAPAPAGGQPNTYGPVKSGDTLRRIAEGVRPEGVSLDQVLVGIYRSNRDAFINNNMNLLRTGRILRVPDAAELSQVSAAEATNEIRVQSADWNSYRQKLAGAVTETPAPESRAAAGKITTRVEDKAAAQEPPKEVLKISKGEAPKPGAVAAGDPKAMQERLRSLEEEATAREKALKESNDRIAALEKTIKDMQRLVELKGAPVPAKPEAAAPKVEPAPAPAPKPEPEKAAAKPEPVPVAEAPKPAETPPVVAEKPAPEAPKAAPKPPITPPPPPQKEFWEEIADDPAMLGGGIAALLGLGGLGYFMARRRRGAAQEPEPAPAPKKEPQTPAPSAVAAAGAPAAAAAAAVATTTMTTPLVDDVDPIQEAEVYINYGRDAQAEEILKEAMAKDPSRLDFKTKLLEIYAARKSRNDFNPLAGEVHAATSGTGAAWTKVAQMGYALDPENSLYEEGRTAGPAPVPVIAGTTSEIDLDFDLDMATGKAGAPTTVTDLPLGMDGDAVTKTTVLTPEAMQQLTEQGAAEAAHARGQQGHAVIPDFDIGGDPPSAPSTDISLEPALASSGPITDINLELPTASQDTNVIDFEFDTEKTAKVEPQFRHDATVVISPENQEKAADLGVEIDLGALDSAPAQAPGAAPAAVVAPDISFDFELPDTTPPAAPATIATGIADVTDIALSDETLLQPPPKAAAAATDFALDTITFDIGDSRPEPGAAPEVKHDEQWYDVQTKFDLAKAYQEMGDKDGAREILAEVIREGDVQQKAEAEALLTKLA
jgi:pilus assembly protein FimV